MCKRVSVVSSLILQSDLVSEVNYRTVDLPNLSPYLLFFLYLSLTPSLFFPLSFSLPFPLSLHLSFTLSPSSSFYLSISLSLSFTLCLIFLPFYLSLYLSPFPFSLSLSVFPFPRSSSIPLSSLSHFFLFPLYLYLSHFSIFSFPFYVTAFISFSICPFHSFIFAFVGHVVTKIGNRKKVGNLKVRTSLTFIKRFKEEIDLLLKKRTISN